MILRSIRDEVGKTGVDCSNPRRKQFVEVQPFAVDPDTGEILNSTGHVVLKEVAPVNQQEIIQSYFETCDFKTILKRIRSGSGESLPTYDGTGSFLDLSNAPKTIMELDKYLKDKKNKAVNKSSVDVKPSVSVSNDELDSKIKAYIDMKFGGSVNTPVESKKEDK